MNIAAKIDFEAAQICSYRDTRHRIEQAGRDFVRREHAKALEENRAKDIAAKIVKERAVIKAKERKAADDLFLFEKLQAIYAQRKAEQHFKPIARQIMMDVCEKYNISPMDMISERRDLLAMIPRHEAQYKIRKYTTMSLPQIGRIFGGRDHTSILNGISKYAKRLAANDPRIIPDTVEYVSQWESYAGLIPVASTEAA